MNNKIVGIIVLYNPNQTVVENIASYIDDLDMLYAVDNSDQKQSNIINSLLKNSKIHYINNNGNQGIAQALNIGANKAIEMGCQWLLTMDQDSSFNPVVFKKYLECFQRTPNPEEIAIFSPNYLKANNIESSCSFTEKLTTITSGSLLNLHSYSIIGEFNEELFIDEVDHEYCLRAHLFNYKVVQFETIFLQHQIGSQIKIKLLGKVHFKNIHAPIRHYYMTRNSLYILFKYHNKFPSYTRNHIWKVFKTLLFALIYGEKKFIRSIYILQAIRHFLIGKMGKYEQ